ncbi:Mur ligase [Obba rivulosa]|uniref:Mur ligase n=1 Tax=Obba rivulosa TaxID=1052685 RepID=A0A8E2B3Z8_9APHY|nr:Mur ligase [Obba rivulosa]
MNISIGALRSSHRAFFASPRSVHPRCARRSLTMSIDLSLDRIRDLQLHLPPYTRPTCHVVGTNGKGSVSAFLTSIFRASAFTTGRFNSPHLINPLDSILLDDVPVQPSVYASARAHVEAVDQQNGCHASSFELLTATALYIFEQAEVDVVVLEAGMGGRLDATNIVPNDAVIASALTAVDLDHQAFLGSTPAAIAREKASVARPGKPFILGQQMHAEVEPAVRELASTVGAALIPAPVVKPRSWDDATDGPRNSLTLTPHFRPSPQPVEVGLSCFDSPLRALLPLHGQHQLANLGTALGVLEALLAPSAVVPHEFSIRARSQVSPESVSRGIQETSWPGRLSFHTISVPLDSSRSKNDLLVLADGAHNPASAQTLSAYLSSLLASLARAVPSAREVTITYILALSYSPPKSPADTLRPLFSLEVPEGLTVTQRAASVRFTCPEGMPWVSPVPPHEMREIVARLCPAAESWTSTEKAAGGAEPANPELVQALNWAAEGASGGEGKHSLVVIAGSLYLVADFYRVLRKQEAM